MPKGPNGQKRKADVIGNAVLVMKIATGEIGDAHSAKSAAAELGAKGGAARAAKLSPEQRSAAAKKAADKRWKR